VTEPDGTREDATDDARDAIAAMLAGFDQMAAFLLELAKSMAGYYEALVASGVPPEYAVQLALAAQTSLFLQMRPPPDS
jgi:hypothetical protein